MKNNAVPPSVSAHTGCRLNVSEDTDIGEKFVSPDGIPARLRHLDRELPSKTSQIF